MADVLDFRHRGIRRPIKMPTPQARCAGLVADIAALRARAMEGTPLRRDLEGIETLARLLLEQLSPTRPGGAA